MPIMSFNAFQRELEKRQVPANIAYMMTLMYEQMGELSKQGDTAAKVMLELANSMQSVVGLHEATQQKLRQVLRDGKEDGIDVASVANEPEPN